MRTGFQQPVPNFLIAPDTAHNRQLATAYATVRGITTALAMDTWDPAAPVDRARALDRARTVETSLVAAARAGSPATTPMWGPDDVARTAAQAVAHGAIQAAEAVALLGTPGTPIEAIRASVNQLHALVNQATHQVARYSWDVPRDSVVFWMRSSAS